ncbi:MAG: FG-GAP repeat protein [Gammaproteobacteria bacterium]|nr:FG-GAP repeat protein [Gammaproteobacteria bacterium]
MNITTAWRFACAVGVMLTCGGAHAVGAPAAALDDFARFAISDAIGREDEAYRARPSGADIEWRNPDQSMTFLFTAQSVRVRSHERSYTGRLTSVGRDANSIEFDAARPTLAARNRRRLRARRGHGLVRQRAVRRAAWRDHSSPSLRRRCRAVRRAFRWRRTTTRSRPWSPPTAARSPSAAEPIPCFATDRVVFDADGKRLGARLVDAASGPGAVLRIVIDDTGARYPVTIDPFIQKAVLEPSDGERIDAFGWSVAADGDTVVVGAPGRSVGPNEEQGRRTFSRSRPEAGETAPRPRC